MVLQYWQKWHPRYSALSLLYSSNGASIGVEIEQKSSRDYSGYASILDCHRRQQLTLPARYSYANKGQQPD